MLLGIATGAVTAAAALATHNSPEELEARVSAVGQLNIVDAAAPAAGAAAAAQTGIAAAASADQPPAAAAQTNTAAAAADGEAVYRAACFACHDAGIAGSPKIGDPAAWADRIARGMETLAANAINGYQGAAGVMPAKGGNPALSDAEVTAAVQYMVDQSQ